MVAACIAASILSYICIPSVKGMINRIVTMFATGDFTVVREFVASYGNYAAAVSFDIVSYAAGLTSMPFLSFFIATGIGQLPATIVYSYVGGMLTGGARFFVTGLMILFALSALIVMIRKIYIEKQDNSRRKK